MAHPTRAVAAALALTTAVLAPGLTTSSQAAPAVGGAAPATHARATFRADAFHTYTGSKPLSRIKPGTVLKRRTLHYSLDGIPTPLTVVQLLFRTTDARGRATTGATSVIEPPVPLHRDRVISYQSFYDSLDPADSPSYAIAGGTSSGGNAVHAELALNVPFLLEGDPVVISDTEGRTADFAAGPEYGKVTLDSIRAVLSAHLADVAAKPKVAMIGYSGGAIATGWAAALAPSYAPDVERRLVGAAEGGVLVEPAHNLHYVSGSQVWAGVLPMALIGAARAYHLNLTPYLNAYGRQVFAKLRNAPILDVLGAYPGLTWQKIAKKKYPEPERIRVYVRAVNRLDLGTAAIPRVPMFIGQGADGALEGTSGSKPGIGKGDGVMIAGDVRSLARRYCRAGTRVQYQQYDATSHFTSVPQWLAGAVPWIEARFAGQAAPSSCGSIAPGNSLAPLRFPKRHRHA